MRSNVPAFAAIVVLAVVGWWVVQRANNEATKSLQNTAQLAAYLNRAQTTKLTTLVWQSKGICASDTDVKGHAKKGDTFEWTVKTPGFGNGENCFKAGEKVQLFAKTSGTSPLDPPEPSGYPKITALAKTSTTSYMYEVWLVDSAGKKLVRMEDPELEIVETVQIVK
jgi:hypothetical protein